MHTPFTLLPAAPTAAAPPSPATERIVFLGGLHRSGTTPLARWLAEHPEVSGLSNTGVHEDEGQHLQTVLTRAIDHGGPGRFALDPAARLTESSPLATARTASRLIESWTPYWECGRRVLLEKSPPNLIRMRFLKALFPAARFVVIVRHPAAVAMATGKWSDAPGLDVLLGHWRAAHENLVADAAFVGQLVLVRYEDLMSDPSAELGRIFAFLGLPNLRRQWPVRRGVNDAYLSAFLAPRSPWRRYAHRRLARAFEPCARPFGYSLRDPARLTAPAPELACLMGR